MSRASALTFFTALLLLQSSVAAASVLEKDGYRLEEDFNGDGFPDLITLSRARTQETGNASSLFAARPSYLTLRVYLTQDTPVQHLSVTNSRLVTTFGSLPGMGTRLHRGRSGTLIIVAYNEAMGLERWSYQLKFLYGKDGFYLHELVYRSHDAQNKHETYDCALNLSRKTYRINEQNRLGQKLKTGTLPSVFFQVPLGALSADALGRPFDLCKQIGAKQTPIRMASYRSFYEFVPEIEQYNKGFIVADPSLVTGDLNEDGVDDAVVSFHLVPEDGGDRIKNQAAVYLGSSQTDKPVQVVGAIAPKGCGFHIEGIEQGRLIVVNKSCDSEEKDQVLHYKYCNDAIRDVTTNESDCQRPKRKR